MSDPNLSPMNFAQLIGPPALLQGEDAAQYEALRVAVSECFEPKNILDEAVVTDVTDKIWEAQRYKKFEVRLIEGSRLSALVHLLMPIFDLDHLLSTTTALEYFGQNQDRSKRVRKLMAAHNITEEAISAKALAMQAGQISYIERMVSNRETSRNALLREHERRQRRAARQSRKRGANDNEAQAKKNSSALD